MKNLSTLLLVFLMGIGMSDASTTLDDRYRGYSNSFIFNEGGIEFAVFPDGQFDFNYLNDGPQFGTVINSPQVNISFNTGFNYDAYVQYDSYGAVIQIENTPIFYDGFGRIIQAGNVNINYRNGWVNRVGNLNVFYNRPGVILRTSGFINSFNRFYVYQPWHGFYGVPLVNNCIVWNTPYRLYYNPFRFGWNYHRANWNRPNYYNGPFTRANVRRSFYRPNDRVNYRSFERGRRGDNGRAIATREARRDREAISRGRRTVSRNDRGITRSNRDNRATSRTSRRSDNNVTSRSSRRSDNNVTSRNTSNRTNRATTRTNRSSNVDSSNRSTRRSTNTVTSRRSSNSTPAASSRTSTRRTTPAVTNSRSSRNSTPSVSNSRSTRRTSGNISSSSRSSRNNTSVSRGSSSRSNSRATSSRSTSRRSSSRR